MKPIKLRADGAAFVDVHIAPLDGRQMETEPFLLDTGATSTSIPKSFLVERLGYTEDYIQTHRILLPKESQPKMANGERADVYKIPITRINIGGHEIQHDYVISSDSVKLSFLLGLDLLSYFKFTFDFDAVSEYTPYGSVLFEFRKARKQDFSKVGGAFAHELTT